MELNGRATSIASDTRSCLDTILFSWYSRQAIETIFFNYTIVFKTLSKCILTLIDIVCPETGFYR